MEIEKESSLRVRKLVSTKCILHVSSILFPCFFRLLYPQHFSVCCLCFDHIRFSLSKSLTPTSKDDGMAPGINRHPTVLQSQPNRFPFACPNTFTHAQRCVKATNRWLFFCCIFVCKSFKYLAITISKT